MIRSVFDKTTVKDLAHELRKDLRYTYDYIVLDSKYRQLQEIGNADIKTFVWGYSPGKNIAVGNVNSSSDIERIVSIKLDSICLPYGIERYDGNLSYTRISVVIKELIAQSYMLSSKMNAHWILCNSEQFYANKKRIEFTTDDFHKGTFVFNKPITYLDSLTISFGSPLYPISFLFDRDTCTATYGVNTTLTCTYPHMFNGSFYITISNFNTADIINDKDVISRMNNQTEILVTGSGNNIIVPIDTSTITPIGGLQFNVFYEDRRIVMPMTIQYSKY